MGTSWTRWGVDQEDVTKLVNAERQIRALQQARGQTSGLHSIGELSDNLTNDQYQARINAARAAIDALVPSIPGARENAWNRDEGNWYNSANHIQARRHAIVDELLNGGNGGTGINGLTSMNTVTAASVSTGIENNATRLEEAVRARWASEHPQQSGTALTNAQNRAWIQYKAANDIKPPEEVAEMSRADRDTYNTRLAGLLRTARRDAGTAAGNRDDVLLRRAIENYVDAANPGMAAARRTSAVDTIMARHTEGESDNLPSLAQYRERTSSLNSVREKVERAVNARYEGQENRPSADEIQREVATHMSRIVGSSPVTTGAQMAASNATLDRLTQAQVEQQVAAPGARRDAISDFARATGMDEQALTRQMAVTTGSRRLMTTAVAGSGGTGSSVADVIIAALPDWARPAGSSSTPGGGATATTGPSRPVTSEDLAAAATKIGELRERFVRAATTQPTTGVGRFQPPPMNEEQAGRAFDDMARAQNRTGNLLLVNSQGMANLQNGVTGVENGTIRLRPGMTGAQIGGAASGVGGVGAGAAPVLSTQISNAQFGLMSNFSSGPLTPTERNATNRKVQALNQLSQTAAGLERELGGIAGAAASGQLSAQDTAGLTRVQQIALQQYQLVSVTAQRIANGETIPPREMHGLQQQYNMLQQNKMAMSQMPQGNEPVGTGMPVNITQVQVGGAGAGLGSTALGGANTVASNSGISGGQGANFGMPLNPLNIPGMGGPSGTRIG